MGAKTEKVDRLNFGEHLNVFLSYEGEDWVLSFSGDLDEYFQFQRLDHPKLSRLIINFERLKLINSVGVQEWIKWMQSLPSDLPVIFRYCHYNIVMQMNSFKEFLPPGGIVESFDVPYECEECGYEHQFLACRGRDFVEETATGPIGNLTPDMLDCPECHNDMEQAIFADKYFFFLRMR